MERWYKKKEETKIREKKDWLYTCFKGNADRFWRLYENAEAKKGTIKTGKGEVEKLARRKLRIWQLV